MQTLMKLATIAIFLFGIVCSLKAQETPSITGTVQQYFLNPHGEVEGILVKEGTVVHFPPHLGAAYTEQPSATI